MSATLTALSPAEVHQRIAAGKAILVDIRESDEFARSHVSGAVSQPLSRWEAANLTIDPTNDVIFTCRTGMRTAGACERLAARVTGPAYVLEGGVDAWGKAGLPLAVDAKAPLEIMRQVQIVAGSLTLLGVLLGWLVAPVWFGLAALVGAGLTFAGATGFCGMARLLMLAPWNRTARQG
jgi:rhodanese-related sulfurtransferase